MLSKDKFAVVVKEKEKKAILGNNEKCNKKRKKMKNFVHFFCKSNIFDTPQIFTISKYLYEILHCYAFRLKGKLI